MNSLVETVNQFHVRCQSCDHFYQTAMIGGVLKLLHATVDPNQLASPSLPTPSCHLSYDFVLFHPCNHCCPEVFAECPKDKDGTAGLPTKIMCSG
jgi:hypothetical protein